MAPGPVVWVLPVELASSKEDGLGASQAASSSGLGREDGYLLVVACLLSAQEEHLKPQRPHGSLRGGQRKDNTDL